jgi:hypothetical protein
VSDGKALKWNDRVFILFCVRVNANFRVILPVRARVCACMCAWQVSALPCM